MQKLRRFILLCLSSCIIVCWGAPKSFATTVELLRTATGSKATIGTLRVDNVSVCEYLEYPTHTPFKFLPAGSYAASVRTDGNKGWRLELKNTDPFKNIQIHVGNSLPDTEGCFLAGYKADAEKPWVGDSVKAMAALKKAVEAGTGELLVKIVDPRP